LRRLFELKSDFCDIVLDLKDVGVVDRDVVCFFVRCDPDVVKLENCPSYISEWMEREKDCGDIDVAATRLSFSQSKIQKRGTYK